MSDGKKPVILKDSQQPRESNSKQSQQTDRRSAQSSQQPAVSETTQQNVAAKPPIPTKEDH